MTCDSRLANNAKPRIPQEQCATSVWPVDLACVDFLAACNSLTVVIVYSVSIKQSCLDIGLSKSIYSTYGISEMSGIQEFIKPGIKLVLSDVWEYVLATYTSCCKVDVVI